MQSSLWRTSIISTIVVAAIVAVMFVYFNNSYKDSSVKQVNRQLDSVLDSSSASADANQKDINSKVETIGKQTEQLLMQSQSRANF